MVRHPEVKWAQRSDKVFLTVELPDCNNPKVKLEPEGKFLFSATVGTSKELYELDLDLFDRILLEESKIMSGTRNVVCVIKKGEKGWWKKLLKGEGKPPPYLKVDWNKWVDEDEENESKLGGFDFDGMGDISSLGEDDGPDSDDEDLLETNTTGESKS